MSVQQALETTRQRNEMLEEYCAQIVRNPGGEITRSLLAWPFTPETPFDSNDAFHDLVGRYREVGIDDSSSTGYEKRLSNTATTVAWSNAARIGRRSNAWPQR